MLSVGILASRADTGELIANSMFSSATGWVLGTGWSIANGLATKTAGNASGLRWVFPADLPVGTYRISVNVSSLSAGSGTVYMSSGETGGFSRYTSSSISAAGLHTFDAVPNGAFRSIVLNADAAFSGSLSRFSLRRIA